MEQPLWKPVMQTSNANHYCKIGKSDCKSARQRGYVNLWLQASRQS